MRVTLLALFLAAGSAVLAPAPARADVGFELSFGAPPGEAISSVDVFYDQLAPYGMWVEDPDLGTVFMPDDAGYVPYTNGHWEYTDVGMVWVSSEPFAWVTSHYGRWWFSDRYQRWAWVPDTTWGPSWVTWRESGAYLGWAPMPPQIVIDRGYDVPLAGWHYCPADRVVDPDVYRYYVPRQRVAVFQREARPIASIATIGNAQVVVGPRPEVLRAHHVTVQPRHVDARAIGRMNASDLRAVETRARQRAPQVQQQNQRRIESHPTLRQAQPAPAPAPGTRVVTPRATQQPRPQPTPQPERRTVEPRPQPQPTPAPQPERRTVEPRPQPQQPPRTVEPRAQQRPQTREQAPRPQPTPQPQARPEPPRPQPTPPPRARPEPPRPQPQARPEPPRPQPQQQRAEPHPQAPPPSKEKPSEDKRREGQR